jgi:hypothetical protein
MYDIMISGKVWIVSAIEKSLGYPHGEHGVRRFERFGFGMIQRCLTEKVLFLPKYVLLLSH